MPGEPDDTDDAIAREAARARARRAAGGGLGEMIPPLTQQEERDARMRRPRRTAWSHTPSPRTSHHTPGGFLGGLVLELVITLGIHLLWPVLVRWMSLRRAAGIVAGTGLGMLCGALVLPRLSFPDSRGTSGDMVGVLLKGEVVAITLAVLVLGFGGMFIALFAGQARAAQVPEERGAGFEAEASLDAGASHGAVRPREARRREARPREARRIEARQGRARSPQHLLAGALLIADPVAVAVTWIFLATLFTGQFFYEPGITVRAYVAGETPPSYFSQPMIGSLVFGVVLAVPLTLAIGAMASNVSFPPPGGRAAGR
ncbi:hypothetical protein ACT3SQ_16895 [Brachybacterium sp. AOP42-C2-15]|uniref:hypothetical protein n=1 Tax=unclassified Brachybacterium TaxID=2623841 RepID=UPI003FE20C2D